MTALTVPVIVSRLYPRKQKTYYRRGSITRAAASSTRKALRMFDGYGNLSRKISRRPPYTATAKK